MKDIEFNLLDEPWIRVMDGDCNVVELSLKDTIINAHKYKSLKGELPTQDIAVMRFILAVLHTIFSRVDENGEEESIDSKKDALKRWKALWDKGNFSEKAVCEYFEKWHERFWLFHPDRPFGQVAGLKSGTDYTSAKLNGEISESSNKIRLFASYSGEEKQSLTYSQTARWILYLNGYDDTSSKASKEEKERAKKEGREVLSTGAGWLGKLGLIFIKGNNLFETLMLNLVMINSGEVQSEQKPAWENETVSKRERFEIAMPDNLAELYTLQSRRLILVRNNDRVTGYKLIGGDFFQKENAFFDPMTVWRTPKKENQPYTPKRHDSSKQMWREFSVLYNGESNKCSGVVEWFQKYLCCYGLIPSSYIFQTAIASVEYGDKDFFVKNVFSDSLSMYTSLLSEAGNNWRNDIEIEIEKCDKLASAISFLARNIYIASGGSDASTESAENFAKAQLYYRLDKPFREWLRNINPDDDSESKADIIKRWQDTAIKTAFDYCDELAENASETAVVGHFVSSKSSDKELYSVPKSINIFKGQVRKIYKTESKEGEK